MLKTVLLCSISFSAYDYVPYPAGVLMSYCLRDSEIKAKYQFLSPEYKSDALESAEFHEKLKRADFLGLTNWVWNQSYNDKIATTFKQYRPDGVVVYGGTNVPESFDLAKSYAAERKFVDIFFCGPSEETFKKFLLSFDESGLSGVVGAFTHSEYNVIKSQKQYQDIKIPTPYLDGVFDELLSTASRPLTAVVETNRGCPYRCTFCDWGGMTRSKIVRSDPQVVKDTITYIMNQNIIDQIEIADANFGTFEVDLEYMHHLVDCQKQRKKKINLTFGGMAKNGSPYAEEIMQLMHQHFDAYHGRKYVKFSFQSHDRQILEIAQRSNVKSEKIYQLADKFKQKGILIDAEMIIGLPGETQKTFLRSIQKNMKLAVNHQKSFVLFVVPNTELASPSYQNKYEIKTKKLLIPHDLYKLKTEAYHRTREDQPVLTKCDFADPTEFQSFEFIYECFSYNSQELMKIYDVWFWFNTLYNAKIARSEMLDSPLSAEEQYEIFLTHLHNGQMPFFEKLLSNFRDGVWNTLVKPEPVTRVYDLYLANFVVKFGMRGNEVIDIYNNQDVALAELSQIYPKINFDHFNQQMSEKEKLRLYFVAADVTC